MFDPAQPKRERFADLPDFAWYTRAGLDVALDALASGDVKLAERVVWNLYNQAAYAETKADGGGHV